MRSQIFVTLPSINGSLTIIGKCFRLAKLSEGQLVDGRLECLYHGWQFEGEGKCVKIPQVCLHARDVTFLEKYIILN